LAIPLALLVGCAQGVPQSEYDAVQAQLAEQQQQAQTYQQQASDRVQEVTAKEQEVEALQEEVAAKEQEVADLQAKLGEMADVTVLIGARPMPTPAPRPTPTPLPAGATPPPPAAPPTELVDEVLPFVFYVETLATGSISKYGLASFPSCVPNSIFKRGSKLVWRFEVFDVSTGKRVTSASGATVKVVLPHGEELTARFSQRAGGRVPDAPWMWAVGWDIPPDYPLGALDYAITVTAEDGRTGTFKQPALISEEADSRVQIVE
jgi:hypothetical protein